MLPAALDAKDVCGLLLTFQAHCVLLMVENSEPPFFIAPVFSGRQYFQLPWMPTMFRMSCCCWHFESIVVCWQNCLCQVSLIPIASYLGCLWASGLLLIFDNIIYGKFDIWSFLFHCLLFRRLATLPAALNAYDQWAAPSNQIYYEKIITFFSECQDFVEPHISIRCVANIFCSFKRMREML